MHELSIAMSLVDAAGEELRRLGPVRVAALHLRLGPLSGVVEEALLFSWEVATEGTPLAGSRLAIEATTIRVACPDCEREATVPTDDLRCPTCHGPRARVVAGRELDLVGLEVVDVEATGEGGGASGAAC